MPKISKKRAIRKNSTKFYISRDVGSRCHFLSWAKPMKNEKGEFYIQELDQRFVLLPKQNMNFLPCLPDEGEYVECNINVECISFDTDGCIKIS